MTVTPQDARYADLVWGTNQRWVGTPDYVRLVFSTHQVVSAVHDALQAGKHVAVRSGGHCYEDFVSNSSVRAVIDLSRMNTISYDPRRNAFAVQSGALLGDVYKALYKDWGVTLPGGSCPTVGAGGHIAGGGFGTLCRLYGLIVDHLYAVEVVVVDKSGTVRAVVATRESADSHRDLWWAHTGGGGGNFGVVTKYWFRSPGATGSDPVHLLPKPPANVLVCNVAWAWDTMTETSFRRLLRNYSVFYEHNSAQDSPYASLFSQLKPQHRSAGSFMMTTQIDARVPGAEQLLNSYITSVNEGVAVPGTVVEWRQLPWLHAATQWPGFTTADVSTRFKAKSAYMRKGFSDAQLGAFYHHLTRTDYNYPFSLVMINSYGGKVNTVAPSATAVAQRDSVIKLDYISSWTNPAEDAKHIGWIREFYRDVYADTGGVPVPNALTDGCFINYPDVDLGDLAWNTSATSWQQLYYKDNYPKLQSVKAKWDPKNVFHHAQSIQLPGGLSETQLEEVK